MTKPSESAAPGAPPLFVELCQVLRARGVVVREETFQGPFDRAGGYCELRGDRLVLLDKRARPAEQFRALLECIEEIGLATLGLAGTDLSPALLAQLNRRGHMPWPHATEAPPLARGLVRQDVSQNLATHTTLGLGGPASEFLVVHGRTSLAHQLARAREQGLETRVLGGGSNLVIADEGIDCCVVLMRTRGIRFKSESGSVLVEVEAGESWDDLVRQTVERGYRGLECLSGIPGTVGATPIQNVGAYGQEVAQTIETVTVMNPSDGSTTTLSNEACRFSYRSSIFKGQGSALGIVVSVSFRLEEDPRPLIAFKELEAALGSSPEPTLADARRAVLSLRRKKSMVYDVKDPNHRSCGSFFTNPILPGAVFEKLQARHESIPHFPLPDGTFKVPAAWLIEKSGLARGTRLGPVGLSSAHTLAIVAHDGARAQDVVRFAHAVRRQVEDTFEVRLLPEPEFWGFSELEDGLPVLSPAPSHE